jgi:hypothetical protein
MKRVVILTAVCVMGLSAGVETQRGGRGGGTPPTSARAGAPIDLAGYWVSPVIEDWKFRMVTPNRGVFDGLPLNAEGRRIGDAWDPARDEAAGEQCRSYSAANIMRVPGRLRIAWEDDSTLRVDTDAGTQTRLLRFGAAPAGPVEASWQGRSLAQWNVTGSGPGGRTGNLKVVTTNLRQGYIRKNGAPHSDHAVVTEYWDVHTMPNGDQWLTVTTKVDDPVYFTRPYLTSTDFKKLPDGTGWSPTPCIAR